MLKPAFRQRMGLWKSYIVLFVLWAFVPSPAFAIRNGMKPGGQPKRVFAFVKDGEQKCTATALKYKRCFITAEHCIRNASAEDVSIYAGEDLTSLTGKKSQKGVAIANTASQLKPASIPWVDWVVIFTEGKTDAGNIPLADMEPAEKIGKATDLGIGDVAHPKELITDFTGTPALSENAPKQGRIYGYGWSKTENGQDKDSGEQRRSDKGPDIKSLVLGSKRDTKVFGAYVYTEPNAQDGDPTRIGCSGDSGGPLFKGEDTAVIYGISSGTGGTPTTCANTTHQYMTVFDTAVIEGEQGVKLSMVDMIDYRLENTCKKRLDAKPGNSGGHVSGAIDHKNVLTSGQTIDQLGVCDDGAAGLRTCSTPDFNFNGLIACASPSSDDCTEDIHEGQTITIVAEPDPGYAFDHWQGDRCPCSTSATCPVAFDSVGQYDSSVSIDNSICEAIFVPLPSPTPSPATSPTPL